MSIQIASNISRGSIVRGFLPHFGEEKLWPRNLLVHGFVFAQGADQPYALAVSRFTYNSDTAQAHDVLFPLADHPVVYHLNEAGLALRTDRIDFVPLTETHFGANLRQRGNVGSPIFWNVVMDQLEKTHQTDTAATLFDRLQPGDRVLDYSEANAAPAPLPASIVPAAPVFFDPYLRALQEKQSQERATAKMLHEEFLAARRAPVRIVAPVPAPVPLTVAPAPVAETTRIPEPWWKTNPALLDQLKEQARMAEEAKKSSAKSPQSQTEEFSGFSLSDVTHLFNGVEIGAARERKYTPAPAQQKKKRAEKPALSAFEIARRKSLKQELVPLFEEALGFLFRIPPQTENGVFLRNEPQRGTILKLHPMNDDFPYDKYGVGIVWDVFKDETGAVAGVEMIPIRRDTEGFPDAITVCNPLSPADMSGFVLLPNHLYRIALTTDYLSDKQPQEKLINPCFLRDVARAREIYAALSPNVFGLAERPANWAQTPQTTIEPEHAQAMEYYALLQKERLRQTALQAPAPAIAV